MITQKVLELALFFLDLVLGAIPLPVPPGWVSNSSGAMATVFQMGTSMGVWFPTGLALTVLTAVFVARFAGLGVKIGRMVLSLFTGGGGNAGG